jgi:bifunctional non-homologous end joining protein LigD
MPRDLEKYRAKRTLAATPEPAGSHQAGLGGLFVVHQHAARRLHWDLRLEHDGVLLCWAVPRGPSPDPADKRLAVQTEDHPIEYADFEGVIPDGNYGAGSMIVFDRGRWVPHGDVEEGLRSGKLLFELHGYKLRGMWTLVKLAKSESGKDWLLIKERDGYVEKGGSFPPESVLSGLTVEELNHAGTEVEALRNALAAEKVPARDVRARDVDLMLCEPRDGAFSKPGWIFELKMDGWRILAEKRDGEVTLRSRNGNDLSESFPEVVRAVKALPFEPVVLDGEVVTLDGAGRPHFQRLQQRARLKRPLDVKRAAVESPATLFAFDLPAVLGFDLRGLPLVERKQVLRTILPPTGPVRYLDHVEEQGEAFYAEVERMGLEGMVGKKADSPYRGGRTPAWVKIRALRTDEFVVVGFSAPKGTRAGFGALHLAQYVGDTLVYSGRAGSGFADQQLREERERLAALRVETPACAPPGGRREARGERPVTGKDFSMTQEEFKATTWVRPEVVAEVRFTEWTDEGLLRHPVFIRFRDDRKARDVRSAEPAGTPDVGDPPPPAAASAPSTTRDARTVPFSNLKKVFWPEEKYTKGDLIEYYRAVSPWLLPYLKDRPMVLTRYPDGIAGKSFYQKDAPDFIPAWMRTVRLWSEHTSREIDYFILDDVESLLYVINLGSIPLHMWASRADSLDRPDWCVLDLDPKGASFADVVNVARNIHARLEGIDLPHYVKTTGSTGLHILIPLGGQMTYDQCRSFGEVLAQLTVQDLPDIATITRTVEKREGKVYVDYLQNVMGQTIVTPYSARPLPAAPVSAPLEWREVIPRLDMRAYNIQSMPKRLARKNVDPVAPVLTERPDLVVALDRLWSA